VASPVRLFGGTQTLLLGKNVKTFATEKDEGVVRKTKGCVHTSGESLESSEFYPVNDGPQAIRLTFKGTLEYALS
jgi:hypothetical protein